KDTAGIIHFHGSEIVAERGERGPDLFGKIVDVAKDGSTVTIEQSARNRGEEAEKTQLKIDDKALVVFREVGVNQAKIENGMKLQAWLKDGSKDAVAKMSVIGIIPERWTTTQGKVVAVAKDGSSMTLEQPAQARGEEPKRVEVKITVNTKLSFSG